MKEKEAIKVLKEIYKKKIKYYTDKEETSMIKEYLDKLYGLCQMEREYDSGEGEKQ